MFLKFVITVTAVFCTGIYIWQHIPRGQLIKDKVDPTYHYIIVGGGTAGCVLANRLSEDTGVKVLLLEAGVEDTVRHIAEIPLAAVELQRSDIDWSYHIEPQKNACLSFENNEILWPSGKALGGSSLMNYLVYSRGNPDDYNRWASHGCDGWSYEDVLPYFIKAENNRHKILAESEYHGAEGPLSVSYMTGTNLATHLKLAAIELGYRQVDYNAERQIGVSGVQATTLRGSRQHTAVAYLRPVMNRPNLHVVTEAHVRKIITKANRAIGVEFIRNDTIYTTRANTEVIVCAGTVGSAQLLLLSGIGPKAHLEDHKIPVVADLPVGENLQDHVYPLGVQYTITEPISAPEQFAKTLMSLVNYLIFGDGFMSSSGIDGIGFFKSNEQPHNDTRPYLEIHLHNALLSTVKEKFKREALRKALNMYPKVFDTLFGNLVDKHGFMMSAGLLHPKSKGTVRLGSSDYKDTPIIDPQYLSHPADLEILLDGIRLIETIADTKAFKHIGAAPLRRPHPHCTEQEYGSDEYWICFIRHNLYSMHHPTGTCKMGSAEENSTVVTPDLKVKGIANLRIVDASVIPEPISSDTSATVVMLAEKAADLILDRVTVRKRAGTAIHEDQDFAEFDHEEHDEL